MENLQWGVPTQRTRKEEKFKTPVITLNSLAKKGAGRKMQFNKAAQEALGLEAGEFYITFGFSNGTIVVLASDEEKNPSSLKITKSYSISNKKTFEYISKLHHLDNKVENHMHLVAIEGKPYMEVSMIEVDGEESISEEDRKESTEEVEEVAETNAPEETVAEVAEEETTESEW